MDAADSANPARAACAHCGLPVPAALVDGAAEQQFCCAGCRTVYELIHDAGMDRYYTLRQRDEAAEAEPAQPTGRRYGEYDDPVFLERYSQDAGNGLRRISLYLEGIHCAACVWLVEKLPRLLPGVLEARLDFRRSLLDLRWAPAQVGLAAVARQLDGLGYPPHPARRLDARERRTLAERRHLVRLAVAGACAGNVMLLALALYAGMFDGMAASYERLFRWLSLGGAVVAVLWPGSVFFRGALAALRTRTPHLDLPIALGLAVGFVGGIVNVVRDRGDIYFDSLCVLIFMLLIGRYLQFRQQRRADEAVEQLFACTPTAAWRVEGETAREVAIEALAPGETVLVRAGEVVPVDGEVLAGRSQLDQALLTGESRPVPVQPGEPVHAGSTNLQDELRVQVGAAGAASRLGRLLEAVEAAGQRRAPVVAMADRLAGRFVVVVLALAAATLALWWAAGPEQAANHAIALLIVACPCALGLATPLSVAVTLGQAARQRVLVKGGDLLERLLQPGTLFLDKTGTLTTGSLALAQWRGDPGAQALAAAVEARSTHPVARAFVAGAPEPAVGEVTAEQHGDGGITGSVDGRRVAVGTVAFLQGRDIAVPGWAREAVTAWLADDLTPVLVAVDGAVHGAAAFGHVLRPDAAEAVARLQRDGWRVGILSGDHPHLVRRVGEKLGLDPALVHGGVTPEAKLARVRAAQGQGAVVMVGDGVNDAAALAAADLGVAVHGGAEASLAAADIYCGRPGLAPLLELVDAARRMLRGIRRNLGVSLTYNGVAVALAMAGLINPLLAAVLMPASSLTVLTLALTGRNFRRS